MKEPKKKKKIIIIIEKGELYPKYELKVTYESRKLDSSGKNSLMDKLFSIKVKGAIFTPFYIRVKREW